MKLTCTGSKNAPVYYVQKSIRIGNRTTTKTNEGCYNPMDYFNNDQDIRRVLMRLINGEYSPEDPELFREIYDSLLTGSENEPADQYFILADFKSYAEAQSKVEEAYRDQKRWAKMAMMNMACSGKFSSDRTIQEYVDDLWHLDKVYVDVDDREYLDM